MSMVIPRSRSALSLSRTQAYLGVSNFHRANLTGRWARIINSNFLPTPGKAWAHLGCRGGAAPAFRAVLLYVVRGPTNETPPFGGTRRDNSHLGAGAGAGGGSRGRISLTLGCISLCRGRRSRGCILLHLGRAQTQREGRLPLLLVLLLVLLYRREAGHKLHNELLLLIDQPPLAEHDFPQVRKIYRP
ncbi:hypothetical protein CI102_15334 [Trichoderma harzianum]|nr:hypothetical protein CI102_15334 [Trichoderma harzianum]